MTYAKDATPPFYHGTRADLAAGRVRFVGEAAIRIAEDVLRILRFFRFHAWYGTSPFDADGLAACRAAAGRLRFAYTLTESPAYGGAHGLAFVQEFLRSLDGEGDSPAGALDALRVVEVLDAAYASAADGQATPVARAELPGAADA